MSKLGFEGPKLGSCRTDLRSELGSGSPDLGYGKPDLRSDKLALDS